MSAGPARSPVTARPRRCGKSIAEMYDAAINGSKVPCGRFCRWGHQAKNRSAQGPTNATITDRSFLKKSATSLFCRILTACIQAKKDFRGKICVPGFLQSAWPRRRWFALLNPVTRGLNRSRRIPPRDVLRSRAVRIKATICHRRQIFLMVSHSRPIGPKSERAAGPDNR